MNRRDLEFEWRGGSEEARTNGVAHFAGVGKTQRGLNSLDGKPTRELVFCVERRGLAAW